MSVFCNNSSPADQPAHSVARIASPPQFQLKRKVNLRDTLLGADISDDRDDLTSDVLAMRLDNLLKLLLGASNDIDLGTVDSQSLCNHETDTGTTTGNEGDLVLDIEDLAHLEFRVVGRRHVGVVSLLLELIRGLVCGLVCDLLRAFKCLHAMGECCE
jgi:hypothetical protein